MTYTRASSLQAHSVVILTLCLCLSSCSAAASGSGLRGSSASSEVFHPQITARDVEAGVSSSLEALLLGGQGAAAQHLARVEASMRHTYQALPKNELGRLAPRTVRYIVHNYFSKEHGWLIKGLEPHAHRQVNVTEMHEVGILQDKAPALVEALLESRQSGRGLSLRDVVAMAAALEWLILEESIELLQSVYALNEQTPADRLDQTTLQEVLLSYLIVLEQGGRANLSDVSRHRALKFAMAKMGMTQLVEYEEDAIGNFVYRNQPKTNPFVPRLYSFEQATKIVEDMARGYGKWQNSECGEMKDDLMELDPEGVGRVPLHVFYSQPKSATYQFSESLEYLKEIGAIDMSVDGSPRVLIANYLTGPSNCISTSTYYSVCCLNECEGLMNDIEYKIEAPTASLARVLDVIGNLSSSSVDAPRQLSQSLTAKLGLIAERNGGEVPLYGRLFAQWLHYAFPNECPYPHIAQSTAALTASHWLDGKASSTEEERKRHIELGNATDKMTSVAEEHCGISQWSDDEILPLQEPQGRLKNILGSLIRMAVQIALLLVLVRMGYAGWLSITRVGDEAEAKGRHAFAHFV